MGTSRSIRTQSFEAPDLILGNQQTSRQIDGRHTLTWIGSLMGPDGTVFPVFSCSVRMNLDGLLDDGVRLGCSVKGSPFAGRVLPDECFASPRN
jgi:hypothetical protein